MRAADQSGHGVGSELADEELADEELADEELAGVLVELVGRLSRRLRRGARSWLAPFGLSDGQARVLRMIGRADGPLRMSDLARRVEIVPRSATTVVEALEAKGLVVRDMDPEDRRSILVRPTEAGAKILAELARARDEAAVALLAQLTRSDRLQLARLLRVLVRAEDGNTGRTVPTPGEDVGR